MKNGYELFLFDLVPGSKISYTLSGQKEIVIENERQENEFLKTMLGRDDDVELFFNNR